MSEKKIVVPEGMLKAAVEKLIHCWDRIPKSTDYSSRQVQLATTAVEAALRWLAENPIEPTENEGNQMLGEPSEYHLLELRDIARRGAVEWQRRCFLAPEPEVPEEVKQMLLDESMPCSEFSRPTRRFFNNAVLEAYRRGVEVEKK